MYEQRTQAHPVAQPRAPAPPPFCKSDASRLLHFCKSVGRAENGRYGIMSDMKKDDVNAVLSRVLTWPAEAQQEAVASLRAIEDEWVGSFELSSDDREALERSADDVQHGRLADDDKVRKIVRSLPARMKVRYTDTALGEIDEICSHIARDNRDAASDVAD